MPSAPISRIPWTTAMEGSRVDGTFVVTTSRPRNPTKSVNVPPTSTPTSIVGPMVRDHKSLRAVHQATRPTSIEPGPPRPSVSVVSQVPRQILRIPFHVEQTVAAVVEGDDRFLVFLLRLEGEVDRTAHRVTGLRRRDEALRLREDLAGLEGAQLVDGSRLDETRVQEDAQRRSGPMVPQPARMDPRGHERVAQRVHLHEGRHLSCVSEVVLVPALRHRRHGRWLDRDEPRLRAP